MSYESMTEVVWELLGSHNMKESYTMVAMIFPAHTGKYACRGLKLHQTVFFL